MKINFILPIYDYSFVHKGKDNECKMFMALLIFSKNDNNSDYASTHSFGITII